MLNLGIILLSILILVIIGYFLYMKLKKDELSKWIIGDELSFTLSNLSEYAKQNPIPNNKWIGTAELLKWNMDKVEVRFGDGQIRRYPHSSININKSLKERLEQSSFDIFMKEIDINTIKMEKRKRVFDKILNTKD